MEFVLISFGLVAGLAIVLVLIARAYPGSGADLLGWRHTRPPELNAGLEEDDLRQLLEAQNAYKRKRGIAELSEADAQAMAREDEELRDRARRSRPAARGRPTSGPERRRRWQER